MNRPGIFGMEGKILLIFIIMVSLLLILGGLSFVMILEVTGTYDNYYQKTKEIKEVHFKLYNLRMTIFQYLGMVEPDKMKQAQLHTTELFEEIGEFFNAEPNLAEAKALFEKSRNTYKDIMRTHHDQFQTQQAYEMMYGESRDDFNALKKRITDYESELAKEMEEKSANSRWEAMLISGVAFAIGFLVCVIGWIRLRHRVTGPIHRAIESLAESSAQVNNVSGQIVSSSRETAEGASEQAASIEETSSSMEQMASMTKKNAENAKQANVLMKEANRVVGKANGAMGELTVSMDEISRASEETSKIIKTIDEIAFQTNLLALNAAVEAARAGEAGAGFAVVAGEVRNLAMRSADAARNTANLIKGTVGKIRTGSDIVDKTNEAFGKVAKISAKVDELIGEIAVASQEQAQGIEQVNQTVVDIDKVVQQIAANAEESASASEEMSSKSAGMKQLVEELAMVVGKKKIARNVALPSLHAKGKHSPPAIREPKKHTQTKALPLEKPGKIRSEDVIPFDDDDFSEF